MSEYIYDTSRVETHPEQGFTGETVVRCRDCKHYKPYRTHSHGMMNRCQLSMAYDLKRDADDFCSRGERRDE